MKKIIQICATNDDTLCLTEDGKVYKRSSKDTQTINEYPGVEHPYGRVYVKGTYYWKEVLEEEQF